MSMARILQRAKLFTQKRPLLFNSIVYGSFYTGAEFAQQSYMRIYKLSGPVSTSIDESPRRTDASKRPLFAWVQKFNEALGLADDQDVSAQSGKYNWAQLKRYAIYGCFLAGPVLHGWYKWLDAFYQGKSARVILRKLFADQFIFTPPLIMMFFVSMSVMEGRSDIFHECKAKFVPTFTTSCMYWLPVQLVNFMVIPPVLRVPFVSVAAFCWVNILCYLKSIPLSECEKSEQKH